MVLVAAACNSAAAAVYVCVCYCVMSCHSQNYRHIIPTKLLHSIVDIFTQFQEKFIYLSLSLYLFVSSSTLATRQIGL